MQNSGLAGKEDELKFTNPDYELLCVKLMSEEGKFDLDKKKEDP
ncbi:hypothetical protein IRB23M11_21250 [Alkalibacterium sp. m-11]